MVKAIEVAQKAARKAIESTYFDKLVVTEHKKIKDPVTKLSSYQDEVKLSNQPCKLSFEKLQAAVSSGSAVSVTQVIKLFLSPDIIVKPGSKMTVRTKVGVTTNYTYSGVPAVYPTHQEIILDLFEGWA